MKIHVFGCSLSHGIWWDKFMPEYKFNINAVPAGDNTTQSRRFQDLVINDQLDENDFVLWQVTYPGRMGFRLSPEHHFIKKNINKSDVVKNLHKAHYKNLLDDTTHLDYVAFNKEWYNTFYFVENVNQELQQLLYNINIANKMTSGKTLVWFAQADMFTDNRDIKFTNVLSHNNIDQLPLKDSIMTWAKENNVDMDKESLHPSPMSYKLYVDTKLKPKIDENIKRNSE